MPKINGQHSLGEPLANSIPGPELETVRVPEPNFYRADHPKIDSTLTRLSHQELTELKRYTVDAICDQAPHDTPPHEAHKFMPADIETPYCVCGVVESGLVHVPNWDAETAYELSVLNWDIANDIAGRVHLFDEWFSGIPV
jgi:hypothetical protein